MRDALCEPGEGRAGRRAGAHAYSQIHAEPEADASTLATEHETDVVRKLRHTLDSQSQD